MVYKVALFKSDEGYAVSVPGLPGCWSQGATEHDALDNIRDAIEDYLAVANQILAQEHAELREVNVA
jgi:predicted RNase H-like HicB family nuclease